MEGKLIRVLTSDKIELQGLYCQPLSNEKKVAVLYIHGLAGNFYENRFVSFISDALTQAGAAFLAANTRGHDYLADFIRQDGDAIESVQIGAAHEIFEESALDIDAWLTFLEAVGITKVILAGHSFGAMKVVFYQFKRQDARVCSMILASPPDSIGLQKEALGAKFDNVLALAHTLVDSGQGNELMPAESFEGYPIDARTYIDFFGSDAKTGIFDYQSPDTFAEIASLKIPLLAFFGNLNEAVVGDVNDSLQMLKQHATGSPLCKVTIIEGAPHNYLGHEEEVGLIVAQWVNEVCNPL